MDDMKTKVYPGGHYEPTQDKKIREKYTLDSKGICFMCLRPEHPLSCNDNTSSCQYSLDSLFQYLELDPSEMLNSLLPPDQVSISAQHWSMVVSLCENCSGITDSFTELLMNMEESRLKSCIYQIQEEMTHAQNDPRRVEEFQRIVKEPGDHHRDRLCLNANLIQTVRAVTIRKCEEVTMTSIPTSVESIKYDEDAPPHKKMKATEETSLKIELSGRAITPDHEDIEDEESTNNPTSSNKAKEERHCPYCRAVVTTFLGLERHMARYHFEHYFLELKDPRVSIQQFREMLMHLFFLELAKIEADKGLHQCSFCWKDFSSKHFVDYSGVLSRLKLHMLRRHRGDMNERILSFQQDPNFLEKMKAEKEKLPYGMGFWCPCGVHCQTKHALKLHGFKQCKLAPAPNPNRGKIIKKKKVADDGLPCAYCRGNFDTLKLMEVHLVKYHCEHFFPAARLDTVTPQTFQRILVELLFTDFMNGLSCLVCGGQFNMKELGLWEVKLHLIQCHHKQLLEKLKVIQEDPNLDFLLSSCNSEGVICDQCGIYLFSTKQKRYHFTNFCKPSGSPQVPMISPDSLGDSTPADGDCVAPVCLLSEDCVEIEMVEPLREGDSGEEEDGQNSTQNQLHSTIPPIPNPRRNTKPCQYCRAVLSDTRGLTVHYCSHHMDHFFQEAYSCATVSAQQFQEILAHLLFTDFMHAKNNQNRNRKELMCVPCQKVFGPKDRNVLKIHLIKEHFPQLEQKLRILQKDPNLDAKLSHFKQGEFCACGVYLSTDGRGVAYAHKRDYCILTANASSSATYHPGRFNKSCKMCGRSVSSRNIAKHERSCRRGEDV